MRDRVSTVWLAGALSYRSVISRDEGVELDDGAIWVRIAGELTPVDELVSWPRAYVVAHEWV